MYPFCVICIRGYTPQIHCEYTEYTQNTLEYVYLRGKHPKSEGEVSPTRVPAAPRLPLRARVWFLCLVRFRIKSESN